MCIHDCLKVLLGSCSQLQLKEPEKFSFPKGQPLQTSKNLQSQDQEHPFEKRVFMYQWPVLYWSGGYLKGKGSINWEAGQVVCLVHFPVNVYNS